MARARNPIPASEGFADLTFPTGGIDLTQGFEQQRPGTCVDALNVRGWDPVTGRNRGGSRPGLIKYLATQTNGSNLVQDLNAFAVSLATILSGATVPSSPGGYVIVLTAIVNGKFRFALSRDASPQWYTPSTDSTFWLTGTSAVRSASLNQKLWVVDGTNWFYWDPSTNTNTGGKVTAWTASAGSMPSQGSNLPRLICAWRGRIVLAGITTDPNNWFMSKVGDPTDFNYFPTSPSPDQAVSGQNSTQGVLGDIVTALIPYTDDVLVMGGQHSLWLMQGDPMAGGAIQLISNAIGVAFGKAWAQDPYGNIYFFSSTGGIYSLVPGQQPQRISQQIEQFLFSVNLGAATVTMAWDDFAQALHVFNTNAGVTATTSHFVWESRTNAWWLNQFANNNHNPVSVLQFFGDVSSDRGVLLGGWDGYVRTFSQESEARGGTEAAGGVGAPAATDDGTAINSRAIIGPLVTPNLDDVLIKDLQAVLGTGSGVVNWQVFAADSAEAAFNSTTPIASGTWGAGRNLTAFVRTAAHALYVEITTTAAWTLERIRCRLAGQGKVRMRGP